MATPSAHRSNNFDALRIIAALMVVLGHAYQLSGRGGAELPAAHTAMTQFGELGVSIFFVISGFLVTMSYERLGDVRAYLANRCLRILPGLAVAVMLTAWVLGPVMSTLGPGVYFAQPQTWLYPLRNVLLYPVTYDLPGVFAANPYPDAVNGSLWTLRLEFSFYLLIPLMAFCGVLNRRGLTVLAVLAAGAYLAIAALSLHASPVALIGARNLYLFVAGAALYAWRGQRLLIHPALLAMAGAAFLIALPIKPLTPFVAPTVLPLLTVGAALHPVWGLRSAARFGDFSYGVYIYAFPVQQALMAAFAPERPGVALYLVLTLALVLPLAALSWHFVERPALGLKVVVRDRLRAVQRSREPAEEGV